VKDGDERLVVLDRMAKSVMDSVRGEHEKFVFVYRQQPIETLNNTGGQEAQARGFTARAGA
jgi:hypothetical protein